MWGCSSSKFISKKLSGPCFLQKERAELNNALGATCGGSGSTQTIPNPAPAQPLLMLQGLPQPELTYPYFLLLSNTSLLRIRYLRKLPSSLKKFLPLILARHHPRCSELVACVRVHLRGNVSPTGKASRARSARRREPGAVCRTQWVLIKHLAPGRLPPWAR